MSVGTDDLHKAINTVWDGSTLDTSFQALYGSGVTDSEWTVLNDQEASAGQPFPYCVYQAQPASVVTRMDSFDVGYKLETRDVPVEFRVHAKEVSGDSRSAKGIAADLIEEIMKVFGGHPTDSPDSLTLDNGNHLITQYQSDVGMRTGEQEYQWSISYLFRLDIKVAV